MWSLRFTTVLLASAALLRGDAAGDEPKRNAEPKLDRFGDALPDGARLRLGTERFRQGGWSRAPVAIFPSGVLIAAAGDVHLTVFDAERGNVVKHIRFKDKVIEDMAVSPDGKRIITVGYKQIGDGEQQYKGDLTVWDSDTLIELKTIPGEERTYFEKVNVFPDGKVAATVDRRGVSIWDLEGNKELPSLPISGARALAVSPDGSIIAVGDSGGTIHLWEWRTKKVPRKFVTSLVRATALAFSPDGQTLAVCVNHGDGVSFWDVDTSKRLRTLPGASTTNLTSMTFTPDGKHLITPERAIFVDRVGMGGVRVWDVATVKEVRFLPSTGEGPYSVSLSRDGSRLAVASSGNIRVWDTKSWKELAADDTSHCADVNGIAMSKNGMILTGSDDYTVRLWDLKEGRLLHKFPCRYWIRHVALTPDGSRAAALDMSGDKLFVWDTTTGKTVYQLPGHKYNGHHDICISDDGKHLLSFGGDLFLRVTDLRTGKAIAEHAIRPQGVEIGDSEAESRMGRSSIGRGKFTPDGKHLLLEVDQERRVIDTSTGKEVRRMGGSRLGPVTISPDSRLSLFSQHTPPQIDPNGKITFMPRDETVRIVKIENDEVVASMTFKDGGIRALACSPDGKHFAVSVDRPERSVHLCAIGDEKPLKSFKLTTRATPALAFSPDGTNLAVGITGGSVLVFDVPLGKDK